MTKEARDRAERLLEHPSVREARERIFEDDERTLEVQAALTEVPAPPFGEGPRGERMGELFREVGLTKVRRDEVGNVLADLPGAGGPPLLVSAHLDTIFAEESEISVRREEGRMVAPGISDDGRGLAGLWALARALVHAETPLTHGLRFVATVGEEGPGDLRGVKHLFGPEGEGRPCRGFVSLDGAGIGRIVTRGLGVRRLRLSVRGPGGHSWVDRGTPNPIQALAAAVEEAGRVPLGGEPPTGLTVARWGGGSSINAIPREAWIEVDLRSESENDLRRVEERVRQIAAAAVGAENARQSDGPEPLTLGIDVIGERPAGATNPDARLVRAAVDATLAVGCQPSLVASSTDANVPMSMGIPAVTMGAGGEAGNAHTPDEWYGNRQGPEGILRALLTVLLTVGLDAT